MNVIFVLSMYYANNGLCNMPQCLLFLRPLNATFWDIPKESEVTVDSEYECFPEQ